MNFARSSAECFRTTISALTICLDAAPSTGAPSRNAGSAAGVDADDAVRLFIGAADGVHVFDLSRGERKHWPLKQQVNGLAVSADGARLFAVASRTLTQFDTRTGTRTLLVARSTGSSDDAPPPAVQMLFAAGCALDREAGALLFCEHNDNRVMRICGLDL